MTEAPIVSTTNNAIAVAFPYSADSKYPSSAGYSNSKGAAIPVKEELDASAKFILWGDNNLWPQKAWEELQKNDLAPMVLEWKVRALLSGGLIYGARYIENGKEQFHQIILDEVEELIERSCLNTIYLPSATHNFYTYRTFFPKLIFNRKSVAEYKRIIEIYNTDSHFMRMGKQSQRTGHITKVWESGRFDDGNVNPVDLKDHPAVDRYGKIIRQLETAKNYIYYPIYNRINGNVAYEEPSWHGIVKSKWMELARHIPIWKASMMSNSAAIKYQFIIHPEYWPRKYKEKWEKASPEDKFKIKQEEVKSALKALTGTEKAGNALWTEQIYDEEAEQMVPLFKVERIDTGKKGGDYIEDSQEADVHIMRSFMTDPTLIGLTPGAKLGAGSGSDKRVAFNHYILLCRLDQEMILEPLNVAASFNDWHKLAAKAVNKENVRLSFRFKNYQIAKLELGSEVSTTDKVDGNGDKKTES